MEREYRLGETYRDSGSYSEDDQFLAWFNIEGSGMRNMGGIRPFKFTHLHGQVPTHAYVVLVTAERTRGRGRNPWEDIVELRQGRIVYWGDAKYHRTKQLDDFSGNLALRSAISAVLENQRALIPPILHFSKSVTGEVLFNGLCVLDRLELAWFEEDGRPVQNYRAHLTILNTPSVSVQWLHDRARASSVSDLMVGGPDAWRRYQASGYVDRLEVWAPRIRDSVQQLPDEGSPDDAILRQLSTMDPTQFEAAVVSMLREMDEVRHSITRTRRTGDGGFDFFGSFSLPPPLRYDIDFLGEAKRYARTTSVGVKDVSRLVARLGRGQYGLFVTTSYFSKQAQTEVAEDAYPVSLISGADVVDILREMRIARGKEISPVWLTAVEEEFASPTS